MRPGSHIWNILLLLSITRFFGSDYSFLFVSLYFPITNSGDVCTDVFKVVSKIPNNESTLTGNFKVICKIQFGDETQQAKSHPRSKLFCNVKGIGSRGEEKTENYCKDEQKSALWGSEETTFKELRIPNIEENMCVDLNVIDIFTFESQFLLKFMSSVKCLSFKWCWVLILEGLLFTPRTDFCSIS